ncbi:nitrate/nitrite two-component system sensor histidine kinase NarQ [Vibrio sp. SCSIO 43136]|uniref:nitrate/nitrite two-component system sensor histidine kinase NarQ n=1 Tax=Vibrio sp. SCSIO 43136 TaxID=2819101 RepID=UPI002074E4E3|nr:nitrate/nitrite two-component system sensor histidine kinase NarQ [Vibrio sp. SCSIO 43136]
MTTGFAIFTLSSSLNDAEAVNVSGSMRMQSYRLAYDIQLSSPLYELHLDQFEHSLHAPSMKALEHWIVPSDIQNHYFELIKRWDNLELLLRSEQRAQYVVQVADFVEQIDEFVYQLQRHSERKLIVLGWVAGIGLGTILVIALFVVHYVRKEIVYPLGLFNQASEEIQNQNFDIKIQVKGDTELSRLAMTFNKMATQLGELYRGMEKLVNEKTHRLSHANDSLKVLYDCSQELSVSHLSTEHFSSIVGHLVRIEGIQAAQLIIADDTPAALEITQGKPTSSSWHVNSLVLDGEHLGTLRWQASLPCPDQALIDNVAQILARGIYYNRAQKQTEQLLLMEERATIARELHDSIAQSLSYLKIQVALLKRQVGKNCQVEKCLNATQAIDDIDVGLKNAYSQLRELLSTFRLTIKEADFGEALNQMILPFEERTNASIEIDNQLSSIYLRANHQVHLLQLIREAVNNSVKHAQASNITVRCGSDGDQINVTIEDDGVGFDTTTEKPNHYGLGIMQERAARLNGDVTVESQQGLGCKVTLTFENQQEVDDDDL